MANEIRRRYNFKSGTITDNPLSNSATTMNSTNLAGLPAITTADYAVLVLDPGGTGNGPEVVYMTAHTGSATSGTIVRGREGTTAVQHNSNVIWIHVATAADYPLVAASSSDRPSGTGLPYEGQTIYQQDTKQLLSYTSSTTGWQKLWSMPWGIVGFASRTSDQTGIGTSATDITSLSLTATYVANRRIKITAFGGVASGGASGDSAYLYIRESSTQLAIAKTPSGAASFYGDSTLTAMTVITPTAGSHTYKVSASQTNGSTGTFAASATAPGFILIEDLGPSANFT
jgi:hypothetical protein